MTIYELLGVNRGKFLKAFYINSFKDSVFVDGLIDEISEEDKDLLFLEVGDYFLLDKDALLEVFEENPLVKSLVLEDEGKYLVAIEKNNIYS